MTVAKITRSKKLRPAPGQSLDDLLEINRLAIAAHEGFRVWLRERHAGHPKLPQYDVPFEQCSEWEQLAYRAAARAVRDAVLSQPRAEKPGEEPTP